MPRLQTSPRARLAAALLLITLVFLAAYAYRLRQRPEDAGESAASAPKAPIEVERFSARLEKTSDEERLTVSLRLRATVLESIECFVFVVARSERGSPKSWAIWPAAANPGMAISAGGHFHAAHPASGHPLTLTDSWQRVDALLPQVPGQPPFDSVAVYVVGPGGVILLERPFAL